ncbi:rod shape-determining protein MreD [Xylanibacter ruminicola]|jgi:rod shape-determining protein MreD|uniref:Membrane protein n=2 Tax=Xylanibacter ruminicola TaxID=839 RepID=D5ETP7_XYLR2|nr:rod shape-determining protein MreD [Xylanibacter ruminicola]ADE82523.1 putative membrane protein [Xylanibacter ruminicola 23]MBP3247102.1 rod shape-determining protein MreD [Prevotella sp.]GJG34149.1 rod shape-determining protein MreD [Xylanibacter ruminicola]
MKIELINRLVMFVALFVAQVLILNHVHLLGVGTPLLYVYFAITFRRNFPKWLVLVSCFLLGLLIDVFSNTPGLAASTMTLVALAQTYLIELVAPRDSAEDLEASAKVLGLTKFVTLSALLTLLYCLVFFALEAFNFFDVLLWLARSVISFVLTMVLILAVESVRSR